MTLENCYQSCGGNYEDVLSRFRSVDRIERFIVKFLDDQSYAELINALENSEFETAFRCAHTLKGVAQNLGFDKLSESSSKLTEILRNREIECITSALSEVSVDYTNTMNAIRKFKSE